jgi:FkbM family methyltransferase
MAAHGKNLGGCMMARSHAALTRNARRPLCSFASALRVDSDVADIAAGPMRGIRLAVSVHVSHAHLSGTSELSTLNALAKLVRPGYICYDLGASIGYMSLLLARTARHVYAFEPAPHAAEQIRRNAAVNGFTNITVVPLPVSNDVREVEFALTDVAYGSAIARGESTWPKLKLATTTLDHFIEDHPLPDLMKIDVEDEEARVLEGATRLLQSGCTTICCELHSAESALTVTRLLSAAGYRLTNLTGQPLVLPERIVPGEVQMIAYPPGLP